MSDRDQRRRGDPLHPDPDATWDGETPVERPRLHEPTVIVECAGFECLDPTCIGCRHHDCHVCGRPVAGHP